MTYSPHQHPSELLDEWQRVTREGLNAKRESCVAHALAWHEQALRIAHRLMSDESITVSDDDRLAAYVVAHMNLADCYSALYERDNAADCLSCAHHHLLNLLTSAEASEALQAAAYRHLRESYAAMSTFCTEHGDHPRILAALARQSAIQSASFASAALH